MNSPSNFAELVSELVSMISLAIPALFAITIVFLTWKIILAWIIHADNENSVAEGRHIALAGVIALVVMVGIWGLLDILRRSLLGI